ncbi:glycolytic enzyme transcriptional activator [Nitzschia inconspicua]|uniref:Glycolytic enzyme transcriptional activator n=1 Tax=Nitzschia inconspicua TaxID=303405 RepID=A0A9K3LNC9_9STRA|nr:glycolytic enzyme transcriptional activator [Nitzschia inconspicua]
MGSFVYTALDGVLEQAQIHRGGYDTAIHFLRCLAELNKVFLQDAAALLCVKEERSNHFIFQNLAVLESQAFYDSKGKWLQLLDMSEDVTRKLQGLCNHLKRCLDDKQMEGNRRRKLAHCFTSIGQLLNMSELDDAESDSDTRHEPEQTFAGNNLFESEEQGLSTGPNATRDATRDTTVAVSRTRVSGSSTVTSPEKRLAPKYHSLKEILDDWQDPNNGFLVLDKKYGRNWRKDWSDSQKTSFSRLSCIYCAVVKYIESKPDHNEALAELEDVFKKKRLSVRGMVCHFQAEGYIHVQKSLGRTKQQHSADDAIEV